MEKIRVSYSSLGTFSSCPRKFEFDKLYPRIEKSGSWYAANVGSALHAGYQHYLTHGDTEKAIFAFMLAFPFDEEFGESNDYRNFEASLSTLEAMMAEVQMNEYELAQIKRPPTIAELEADPNAQGVIVPAIEVPFELNFKGLEVPPCKRYPEGAQISFIGYIDAVMQNKLTGLYRTLDIKTTRMKLDDATGKFKFDTQQIPYGIVIEHIAQATVESFEVLYLDCFIDLLDPQVKLYGFGKTQTDIEEWCTNKMIQFQQLIQFISGDYFPRTEHGCLFYNQPCRYLDPCMNRDYDTLMQWFTLGQEPVKADPYEPWIIADIEVGA